MTAEKVYEGRRSHLEIAFDVMEAIAEGECKPTRLIYRCNLSYNIIQPILRQLLDRGLIAVRTLRPHNSSYLRYNLTDKGLQLVDQHAQLLKMFIEK